MLLDAGCWEGAYYLAGYAIECALKACIAKRVRRHDFPDRERVNASYTHKPAALVIEAGLQDLLKAQIQSNRAFDRNWSHVLRWTEASRYGQPSEAEARQLYAAIADRRNGVLRWITRHW